MTEVEEAKWVLRMVDAQLVDENTLVLLCKEDLEAWSSMDMPPNSPTELQEMATNWLPLNDWIAHGWIEKYDEKIGIPCYGLRMSIQQAKEILETKIAPKHDYVHLRTMDSLMDVTFPQVDFACRQIFFHMNDPQAILYTAMGLRLISQGKFTVATYSREMRTMGADPHVRTLVTNYLAKALKQST